MATPEPSGDDFRPRPLSVLASAGIAAAATVVYLGLAAWLTLTFDFFGVPANRLIPVLMLVCVTGALCLSQSRPAALATSASLPPLITLGVFIAIAPPYIRQSLGFSHTAGRAIIALGPGLAALILAAKISRRPG